MELREQACASGHGEIGGTSGDPKLSSTNCEHVDFFLAFFNHFQIYQDSMKMFNDLCKGIAVPHHYTIYGI